LETLCNGDRGRAADKFLFCSHLAIGVVKPVFAFERIAAGSGSEGLMASAALGISACAVAARNGAACFSSTLSASGTRKSSATEKLE